MNLSKKLSTHTQTKNTTITPQKTHQMINSSTKHVLLHVRSHEEYKQKHISRAKLIPIAELNARVTTEIPETYPILIYCKSGARASHAVKTLHEMGYANIHNIGGIMNWPYETNKE